MPHLDESLIVRIGNPRADFGERLNGIALAAQVHEIGPLRVEPQRGPDGIEMQLRQTPAAPIRETGPHQTYGGIAGPEIPGGLQHAAAFGLEAEHGLQIYMQQYQFPGRAGGRQGVDDPS